VNRGSLGPNRNPWMALFTYLDAGGTKDHPAIGVAGFIAREDRWLAFDREWVAALQEFGVSELHMKHFTAFRGEFQGWDKDEPKRRRFIARVAGVIKTFTDAQIGRVIFTKDYEDVNHAMCLREALGGPYAITALWAMFAARSWRDAHHAGEPMAFFIERGDNDQGELFDVLRRLKFDEAATPLNKRTVKNGVTTYVYPFQACDFLAYEMTKGAKTILAQDADEVTARRSLLAIGSTKDESAWGYIDRLALSNTCRRLGVPVRKTT
jgi:hypothetical protein